MRLGLGASRGRVVRQLLTESLLLALLGGVGATLAAGALSRAFVARLDTPNHVTALTLGNDWRVLAFIAAVSLLTCVFFGLAPALSATTVSPSSLMRANARGATSGREVIGVRRGLLDRPGGAVRGAALRVIALRPNAAEPAHAGSRIRRTRRHHRECQLSSPRPSARSSSRVQTRSGRTCACASGRSGGRARPSRSGQRDSSGNDVWPEGNPSQQFGASFNWVGQGYFETLHTPVVAGRSFTDIDTPQSIPAAVVNETFAARLGAEPHECDRSALHARSHAFDPPATTFEVVGSSEFDICGPEGTTKACRLPRGRTGNRPGVHAHRHSVVAAAAVVTAALTRAFADVDPRIGPCTAC